MTMEYERAARIDCSRCGAQNVEMKIVDESFEACEKCLTGEERKKYNLSEVMGEPGGITGG